MRVSRGDEPSADTVIAAQRGDRTALDGLISAYLPLLYNIAGRAMNGHAGVDDVVQETLLRVIRGIRDLRDPQAFPPDGITSRARSGASEWPGMPAAARAAALTTTTWSRRSGCWLACRCSRCRPRWPPACSGTAQACSGTCPGRGTRA